ncbi:phosphate/phosphite/phosphonate ABC transporter substrate-binding protein [Phormidium sp. CLA17]|uniref:phosphate/phosphite/phosphonate ABC transporter substrate-binding protein n=1 Tax=Leptolyngbya sp. Cla-17 TaxID=2803751 RepID=UPI00149276EC|nr:phosphate/phosphite/phosphonate ABC transporter substrate-binding protein [Leptolyngbya sp. Cla-17]MBM0743718.1 phosphate/phosphite/phosphonate ABC transporter substrate-binding protein [Leptolyngbya sp. Cla-17]
MISTRWLKLTTGAALISFVGFNAALSSFLLLGKKAIAIEPTAPQFQSSSASKVQLLAQANAKKIQIVFPGRADATDLKTKIDAVASFLTREMGMPVEGVIADDTAAVEALRANRADVAFLSSRPALKAQQLANARLYLAEVRPNYSGGHTYRSIFVVPKDSALKSRASNNQTLAQLRGKKIAFTSPTSGSGFIFPVSEMVKQGLVPNRDRVGSFFKQVTYGNGYSGALQAVLRGQADVAAVSEYTLRAPYITEAEAKKLRVLAFVSNVPAHGIAIDDDVPTATRNKLINAMMKLNEPANNKLLKDLGNATKLVRVDHDRHLNPMREALKRAGIE